MMARPPKVKSSYYKRPAAALERGGGFYVPGLEGNRLRLAAACVLSLALLLNRIVSEGATSSQLVSETLGAAACALLFIQVFSDRVAESREIDQAGRAAATARLQEKSEVSPLLSEAQAEDATFVAATVLKLTPASFVMLLGESAQPLLRCGRYPATLSAPAVASVRRWLQGSRLYVPRLVGSTDTEFGLPDNIASVLVLPCPDTRWVMLVGSELEDAFSEQQAIKMEWLARYLSLRDGL